MDPLTMIAIGAGALFLLKQRSKNKGGNRPRITIAADCSSWDIPEPWYVAVAAPKYVSLLPAFPDTMALETRVSRITENILAGETGSCAAKDLPNLPGAMRGLFDHIGEYVREGVRDGGNPFLPGLAKYVVASEMFRNVPVIVVRRPPMPNPGGDDQAYAWAVGKWGTTVQSIMSKLATLAPDNDDEIESMFSSFGYEKDIDLALTKGRAVALLGPSDTSTLSPSGSIFH